MNSGPTTRHTFEIEQMRAKVDPMSPKNTALPPVVDQPERGTEQLSHSFGLIDILPWGRQEELLDSPEGWDPGASEDHA
jgi:predicted dithiol-disulfide oxidoreductase (DUF899 family)